MKFQVTAAVLSVVSLIGANASALPLLHRHHHRTYVVENNTTYVAPTPVPVQPQQPQPQVNVQVAPNYAPRGGGPTLDEHQLQEQQQLRDHQLQEQQDLQNHQMRESGSQY